MICVSHVLHENLLHIMLIQDRVLLIEVYLDAFNRAVHESSPINLADITIKFFSLLLGHLVEQLVYLRINKNPVPIHKVVHVHQQLLRLINPAQNSLLLLVLLGGADVGKLILYLA